jgi:hypothetical protein
MQPPQPESEPERAPDPDDARRWLGRTPRRRARVGARTFTLAGLGFGGVGTLGLGAGHVTNSHSADPTISAR